MTAIEDSMGIGWHATQEPEYQHNEYTAQKMQTTIIHIDISTKAVCNHFCTPRGDEEEANGHSPCSDQRPVGEQQMKRLRSSPTTDGGESEIKNNAGDFQVTILVHVINLCLARSSPERTKLFSRLRLHTSIKKAWELPVACPTN